MILFIPNRLKVARVIPYRVNPRIFFEIPSGGDYSGMELDIEDANLVIEYTETTTEENPE